MPNLALALAARNKLTLTPRMIAGDPKAFGALGRSVRWEIAAVALILTVTVALTTPTSPLGSTSPRAGVAAGGAA